MGEIVPFLVFVAGFAAVLSGLAWLASRARRRGIGGSVMSAVDEIFHPIAYQAYLEIRVQDERAVPMPSPDDRPQWSRTAVSPWSVRPTQVPIDAAPATNPACSHRRWYSSGSS